MKILLDESENLLSDREYSRISTVPDLQAGLEWLKAWCRKYANHGCRLRAVLADEAKKVMATAIAGHGTGWYRGCADAYVTWQDGQWETREGKESQ